MSDDRYDIIIQYLNGEMNDEQKMLFGQQILADKELQEDVTLLADLRRKLKDDEIYSEEEQALAKNLSKISTSFFTPVEQRQAYTSKHIKRLSVQLNSGWTWLAAACITGIISLSIFWFFTKQHAGEKTVAVNPSKDNRLINKDTGKIQVIIPGEEHANLNLDKLFADNFEKDKIPEEGTEDIGYAMSQYQRGKYADAIYALKAAGNDVAVRGNSGDSTLTAFYIDYYMALSYMLNNEAAKAIPLLEKATQKSKEKLLQAKSEWYLSLACIKTENIEKARSLLLKLSANKAAGNYKDKAGALLLKLGK